MIIYKHRLMPTAFPKNAAEGEAEGGAAQLSSILGSMESSQGDVGEQNTDPNSQETDTTTEPGTAEGSTNESESSQENQDEQAQQNEDPTNSAFARMRVQNRELLDSNKQLAQTVQAIAKSMGIEGDLPEVLGKLSDTALKTEAEKQKVPVELLKRLQDLEGRDEQYRAESLKASANTGFNTVREEFQLSNEELIKFAGELDQAGINPYMTEGVNIRNEFVARNLDLIVDRKVQAALKRDSNSENHSSTPGDKSGGSGEEKPKITTQQGLKSLLRNLNI